MNKIWLFLYLASTNLLFGTSSGNGILSDLMHLEHPHLVDTKLKRILVRPKAMEIYYCQFLPYFVWFSHKLYPNGLIDYSENTNRIFNL